MQLPHTRKSKYFWRNKVMNDLIKKIINAENREKSLYWLNRFKKIIPFFNASYHKRFIRSIIKNYSYLTAFYDDSKIRVNTNNTENIIKQINRKLKNTDGMHSETNINSFIHLWTLYYYLKMNKRFDLKKNNWLKCCLKINYPPNKPFKKNKVCEGG